MRKKRIALAMCALIGIALIGSSSKPDRPHKESAAAKSNQVREAFGQMPLYFEPNEGQAQSSARFVARGAESRILFTDSDVLLTLDAHTTVTMRFLGSTSNPEITGADPRPGKTNYLIGRNPQQWHTGVPQYGAVRYKEIYPGIDAVFHANQRQMEYDFVLAPGADPNRIAFTFDGLGASDGRAPVSIASNGDLVIQTTAGEVRQLRPVVHQQHGAEKINIDGRYEIRSEPSGALVVGLHVNHYDRGQTLVIDPVFRLSASQRQPVYAVTYDSAGNWYLGGQTTSPDFPVMGGLQSSYHATTCTSGNFTYPCNDAYIVKLNPAGDTILYATFLGGGGDDNIEGIGIDGSGNIRVAGDTTSSDFPAANAVQPAIKGGRDLFVAELDPTGSTLLYSTYFGGSKDEQANGIAVDAAGNSYIAGGTQSVDFPTLNPFQGKNGGGTDGIVAKFSPTGTLIYSSYLGGSSSWEGVNGITIDSGGNAYVTGYTQSPNFPTVNPIQKTLALPKNVPVGTDAFVTKINAAGSAIVYSTFLGGTADDYGNAIAVDSTGNAYITGQTSSTDFPTANPFQAANGGGNCNGGSCSDAFVTKINAAGSALVFSSYLGGNNFDAGDGIGVDGAGQVYIGGTTSSTNFPTVNPTQSTFGGMEDLFISIVKPDGSAMNFSTYYGTSALEFAYPGAFALELPPSSTPMVRTAYDSTSRVNPVVTVCGGIEKPPTDGLCLIFETLAQADLAITEINYSIVKDSFGNRVRYDVVPVVVNNGPAEATTVTMHFTANGWGPDCQQCIALGSLIPGSDTIFFIGSDAGPPPQGATLQLNVTADQPDPVPSNNSAQLDFYSGKLFVSSARSSDWLTWGSPNQYGNAWGSVSLVSTTSKIQVSGKASTAATAVPAAVAIFGFTQNNILVTEAGVLAASPVTSARMFVDTSGGANSGVALVNPNASAINVTATARDASGTVVSTSTVNLPPNGHVAEFPNQMGLTLPANFFGTLTLSSTSSFGATSLRLANNVYRESIFSALPVADLNASSTASSVILPQIVDGGGVPTRILLMNTSASATATGTISLFDDTGAPLSADFGTAGHQSQLSYSLPPNGTVKFSTTGIGQQHAGYAVVTAQTGPLPAGSAIFADNNAMGLASEAGVLAAPATTSARMYTEVSKSDVVRNTGLALVNPGSMPATITLSLIDNLTDQARTATVNLAAHAHTAQLLTQLFPDVPADNFKGTLTLTSNVAVAIAELRLTTNQRGDLLLSTLPIADLNNPPTAPEYLPQIVNGGGFITDLILINTTSNPSTVQINFYDDTGAPVTSPFP